METLFDQTAAHFRSDTDDQIARNAYTRGALFVDAAERHLPAGGRVLDYGCGPGRISRLLAEKGYDVHGIDRSTGMLAEAQRQPMGALKLQFTASVGDGEQLETGRYDGIVCSSVIEYVPDAVALLRHFARALAPGGCVIISFANRSSLWRRYADWRSGKTAPHYALQHHIWTYPEFVHVVRSAGFAPASKPVFFETPPLEKRPPLRWMSASRFCGTLGLAVIRPTTAR